MGTINGTKGNIQCFVFLEYVLEFSPKNNEDGPKKEISY